ncbi:MAG: HU family DNA-binding protein [Acidimicrobiales bacterium]
MSEASGLSRRDAETAIEHAIYEITSAVRAGDPVRITGFGTFRLRERAARTGRNPQTGAAVRIKASKGIAFAAGATLKSQLNSRGAPPKPSTRAASAPAARPAASSTGRKTAAAKAPAAAAKKTAAATKPAAKKVPAKKVVAATKPAAKKVPAKKVVAATKPAAKKVPAKKVVAKKATAAAKTTVRTAARKATKRR